MRAWTLEDYHALLANWKTGVLNIQYPSGGGATFVSSRDMKARLEEAEAYLSANGLLPKPTGGGMYSKIRYSRGR